MKPDENAVVLYFHGFSNFHGEVKSPSAFWGKNLV
jgi:hypothetical protein